MAFSLLIFFFLYLRRIDNVEHKHASVKMALFLSNALLSIMT